VRGGALPEGSAAHRSVLTRQSGSNGTYRNSNAMTTRTHSRRAWRLRPGILILCTIALVAGLSRCASSPPAQVISQEAELGIACRAIGELSAKDGKVCMSCAVTFDGTRERAIQRLARMAGRLGANYVLLETHQERTIRNSDGVEVIVAGTAYSCR
jgi:hypothetical protein